MIIRFSLLYRAEWGQRLAVCGSLPALGQWAPDAALPLHYDEATGYWSCELELPASQLAGATYKYLLLDERDGGRHWEWGPNRTFPATTTLSRLELADWWRAPAEPENELFTAAFTEALFRRAASTAPTTSVAPAADGPAVRFQLAAPRVAPDQQLCVLGSDEALGAWDNTRPLLLSDADYPTWTAEVTLATPETGGRYKYGIWDPAAGQVVTLEEGDDRWLPAQTDSHP